MLPFHSGTDAPTEVAEAPPDPLLGDWAEGLRGPVREVPLKRPQRLRGQGPTPRPLAAAALPASPFPTLQPEQRTEQADLRVLAAMAGAPPAEAPRETEVEAPDAWANTDDQLASVPPPPRAEAEAPLAAAPVPLPGPAPDSTPPQAALPDAGLQRSDETPQAQLDSHGQPAQEPAHGEEVVLLSDAELAEDEPAQPLADAAPAPEAAPAEPAVALPAPAAAPATVEALEAAPVLALPAPSTAEVAVLALPPHAEAPALPAAAAPDDAPGALDDAPPMGFQLPADLPSEKAVEAAPLTPAALSAPAPEHAAVPPEGVRGEFSAPFIAVAPTVGWAAPETAQQETGETEVALRPVLQEPSPDATVHEGAPIVVQAEAPRAAPPEDDLENTVLSRALEAKKRPAAPEPLPSSPADITDPSLRPLSAAALAAAPATEATEPEPEPLPEDAIAGHADPSAPWVHAQVEIAGQHAATAHTPWDAAATGSEWSAGAHAGEWAGAAPAPSAATPWTARTEPASPAWGAEPPAAAAGGAASWGAPAAAPQVADAWASPAPAAEATAWGARPTSAFSAAALASLPGAAEWVIEPADPPVATPASSWESAPSTPWAAPASAPAAVPVTQEWEAKTQTGFAVAPPEPQSGAMLSAAEPPAPEAQVDRSLLALALDDADLPVPVYEPEPVKPSGPLAVAGEHRVAVHTRAGRTRRGVVKDIDLAGTGFALQPQSGAGARESVQAAEVKAVFFMLPTGEKPAPGAGPKVRVTFEDGRTIEGQRDGADAPEGFFLVPSDAARTNTRRIFVARAAVQELREG